MNEMGIHDEANIFPLMNDAEFEALKTDIKANGLKEPIVVHEGKILDGRNRLRACQEVGVEPRFEDWDQKGDQFDFVVGANMVRRHLNSSQRALVAYEVVKRKAIFAKGYTGVGRSVEEGSDKASGDGKSGSTKNKHDCEAAEMAAKRCGTNRQYVTDIKKIEEKAPEKLDEIKSGRKTVPQVKRELNRSIKKEKRIVKKTSSSEISDPKVGIEAPEQGLTKNPTKNSLRRFISHLTEMVDGLPDDVAEMVYKTMKNHIEPLLPQIEPSLVPDNPVLRKIEPDKIEIRRTPVVKMV